MTEYARPDEVGNHPPTDSAVRPACAPLHGVRIILEPSPAAVASCRCGFYASARGREGASQTLAAYEAHRTACTGRTALYGPPTASQAVAA